MLFLQQFLQQITEQEGDKPPLNRWRIVAQIVVGFLVGTAVHVILLLRMGSYNYGHFGAGVVVGHIIGSVVGIPIAVYVIGNIGNETGSLLLIWFGSIVGGAVAPFLTVPLLGGLSFLVGLDKVFGVVLLLGISSTPVVGATIGFNLTRRHKLPRNSDERST